jgi:hypothetical protein
VREPDTEEPPPWLAAPVWTFRLRYPDGARDAEALMVSADGSTLWIVEKTAAATATVFEAAVDPAHTGVLALSPVASFDSPGIDVAQGRMVTGADLHPSGRAVALRVYTGSFVYLLPDAHDLGALATAAPQVIAYGPLSEPQGEAIAWSHDGLAIYTASEDAEQSGQQPLHRYECAAP